MAMAADSNASQLCRPAQIRRGRQLLKAGDEFLGQGLLDHANKATLAMSIANLAMPLEELSIYAVKLEELEEEAEDPSEPRKQTYPAAFAFQVLLFTVKRLSQSKRMSPQMAAEMLGPPGTRSAAGPGLFLASCPRLCDAGGGPSQADVEKTLGECFVGAYLLDLLARGCESELRQAATTFLAMLSGWAAELSVSLDDWATDLTDMANAMLCVSDDRFTLVRMTALSKIQAAHRGVARKVSEAFDKKPWASKIQHAWSKGMSEINCRPKLEALLASLPGRPEAWEEAAAALPELRTAMQPGATEALETVMWRVLAAQHESFESGGGSTDGELDVAQAQVLLGRLRVGRGLQSIEKPPEQMLDAMEAALSHRVTSADLASRQTLLFKTAAQLELDSEASAEDSVAMRLVISTLHEAAVGCCGMRLGTEELGPALARLSQFVEDTAGAGELDVGADVVQAAVDCALALEEVMGPVDPVAEALPATGAAKLRLMQLAAMLQVMVATAEFDNLGPDFETRLAADSNQIIRSVLDALARLDSIPSTAEGKELPPVEGARSIVSSYWVRAEKMARAEVASTQAKLLHLNEPSWKSEMADQVSWDELVVVGGDYLHNFDTSKMLDATRPLKKSLKKYREICTSAKKAVMDSVIQEAEAALHLGLTTIHEARPWLAD